MNAIVKNIPNAITCLNVACGTIAIIFASYGADFALAGINGYGWASIFIGLAALWDFLDGFSARLLHAYSEMGKELDSLCDAVSFGVAPAMLVFFSVADSGVMPCLRWLAILIPVFAVLRLAKFNIDTRQTTSFIGLPVPANAIFWIGFSAFLRQGCFGISQWYIFIPLVLVECWLMVSPIKLFSLKFKTFGWKGNQWRWILILSAVFFVACMGVPGLMWLIVAYVAYGLLAANE